MWLPSEVKVRTSSSLCGIIYKNCTHTDVILKFIESSIQEDRRNYDNIAARSDLSVIKDSNEKSALFLVENVCGKYGLTGQDIAADRPTVKTIW